MTTGISPGERAAALAQARELVRGSLDLAGLIDRIGDDEDLVDAGVNSGEVVNIALRCEDHLRRALTDEELARLSTIRAVAELLRTGDPEKAVS